MLISLSQLKLLLRGVRWTADELAEKLTLIGHESETLNDQLIDVALTPNRGDCYSLYGLARDLAACYDLLISPLSTKTLPPPKPFFPLVIEAAAKAAVLSDELLKIDNYHDQPSPLEIQRQLALLNLQPKNLAVDLGNLVSYEFGVPLHVFDYERISDGLSIALNDSPEPLTLLDGTTRQIPKGALTQRSGTRTVDLAGVMGAQNSAISSQTKTLVVQAASFAPNTIRQTTSLLGWRTEAARQYERGVDPAGTALSLGRYRLLIEQVQSELKVSGYQYYQPSRPERPLALDRGYFERLLGVEINQADLNSLARLGIKITDNSALVPSWRFDLSGKADLAEELLRLKGFDTLKGRLLSPQKAEVGLFHQIAALKAALLNCGATEIISYSFTAQGQQLLKNPPNQTERYLRPTLLDGLVAAVKQNPFINKGLFFEIGEIYAETEETALAVIISGYKEAPRSIIEAKIAAALGLKQIRFSQVDHEVLKQNQIRHTRVFYWEAKLDELKLPPPKALKPGAVLPPFSPIGKFPPIVRDLTLVVSANVSPQSIATKLKTVPSCLIVELVDSFTDRSLGPNKVALTFRLIFQDPTRSLEDETIGNSLDRHLDELSQEIEFQIR